MSGCKTKKAMEYSGPVPDRSNREIMTALSNHNYDFEWYACETGISLDTPDEGVSGKAYIRVRKDSIIWASMKKLGIEAVRTLVTPKTYIAANRLDHTYQKGSTEDVFSKMGISLDFRDAQQAIFGNIIIPDSNAVSIDREGIQYVVKATDQDLQLKYWVNAYTLNLDKVKMVDYRGREINIDYSDYRILESGEKVAFYRQYVMPYNGSGDAEIFMKVKKIEINIPKKTRFSISSRYERIN